MPENEINEEFNSNEINLNQQNALGGEINTPRMNEPYQQIENMQFIRKSHEIGFSYYNQHAKKKSFDINPLNNKTVDESKIQEKDKKPNLTIKNKNISITPNSIKSKENRSLTPNTKDQMKFEGKIKKSVQRQFIKPSEREEKKNTTFRKK